MIGCAKGIFAEGILGGTGFSLLRWEKRSETPSCGGKKGLRLPRSLGRSMRNEGVSDPFSHRKRESQTLFPTAKGKTPYLPKSPQRSATHDFRMGAPESARNSKYYMGPFNKNMVSRIFFVISEMFLRKCQIILFPHIFLMAVIVL